MLTPGGRTVWELTIRTQHYLKLSLWVFSLAVYAWQPDSSCNGHTKVLPKVNHLSSFTVFKWPSTTLPFSRLSELRSGTLAHLKACLKAPQLAVRSGDENWLVLSFSPFQPFRAQSIPTVLPGSHTLGLPNALNRGCCWPVACLRVGCFLSPPSRADLTASIIHLPISTTHDRCGQDTALPVYILRERTASAHAF